MTFRVSNDSHNNNYLMQRKQKQPSFKGVESAFFTPICRAMQTNKVVDYILADFISMIIPRTIIDWTRSPDAGMETGRREVSSVTTECVLPGAVALGVALSLNKLNSHKSKVSPTMFTVSEAQELYTKAWLNKNKGINVNNLTKDAQKECIKNFYDHVFENVEGLVGDNWKKLSEADKTRVHELSERLVELTVEKRPKKTFFENVKGLFVADEHHKKLNKVKEDLVSILGAGEHIRVSKEAISGQKGKFLSTTAHRMIENLHIMTSKVYTKLKHNEIEPEVNKLIKLSKHKSIITLAGIATFGFSQQFINRYLTKKKTGSDAFVGLSEEERKSMEAEKKDPKAQKSLWMRKIASVAGILTLSAMTIAGSMKPSKVLELFKDGNLMKKLEFNSGWVHTNQLRLVYAVIIAGRMLAASDKHELRETDTRDSVGFLNWLVLGGVVSKLVGRGLSKVSGTDNRALLNYDNVSKRPAKLNSGTFVERAKNAFDRFRYFISNQSLKTHAEIDAMDLAPEMKTKLRGKLNLTILSGLAYSTIALGVLMPWYNKHYTKKLMEQKKKQAEENKINNKNNIDRISISKQTPPANIKALGPVVNNELFSDFAKPRYRNTVNN